MSIIIGSALSFSGFFDDRYYSGEEWLIEYEYAPNSFPIELVEKILSKNTNIYNEKFKIIKIESISDYMKRYGSHELFSSPLQKLSEIAETTDDMYIVHIGGNWKDSRDLIKKTLEGIDGVTNVEIVLSWVS